LVSDKACPDPFALFKEREDFMKAGRGGRYELTEEERSGHEQFETFAVWPLLTTGNVATLADAACRVLKPAEEISKEFPKKLQMKLSALGADSCTNSADFDSILKIHRGGSQFSRSRTCSRIGIPIFLATLSPMR
jgi:hypothetical protein